MIKVIIVDDEISSIESLKWEIENFCENIEVRDTFTNPKDAISAINYLKPDCVFLDIEMPEMDGFQLLNKLEYRDFDLIITTAYDNYAIRAFKESAIDYILKPVDSDDLIKAVSKVQTNKKKSILGFDLKRALESFSQKRSIKKISLSLTGKIIYVEPNDILYCKADGNYTVVYFLNKKKEMLSKKIKKVEELFDNNNFFRVHNSYLVNTSHIKEFYINDGYYLTLENETKIPVARSKKDELLQLLGS